MPTTAEHIKESDLPESIRERLQALPNRWYTITIKEEVFSPPSCMMRTRPFLRLWRIFLLKTICRRIIAPK